MFTGPTGAAIATPAITPRISIEVEDIGGSRRLPYRLQDRKPSKARPQVEDLAELSPSSGRIALIGSAHMSARAAVLAATAICLSGCAIEHAGPSKRESTTIERDSSELVRVNLHMGAGDLRVRGGADKLARADFVYNIPSWKPYVRYHAAAGNADLEIEQPGASHTRVGHARYEWDLRL